MPNPEQPEPPSGATETTTTKLDSWIRSGNHHEHKDHHDPDEVPANILLRLVIFYVPLLLLVACISQANADGADGVVDAFVKAVGSVVGVFDVPVARPSSTRRCPRRSLVLSALVAAPPPRLPSPTRSRAGPSRPPVGARSVRKTSTGNPCSSEPRNSPRLRGGRCRCRWIRARRSPGRERDEGRRGPQGSAEEAARAEGIAGRYVALSSTSSTLLPLRPGEAAPEYIVVQIGRAAANPDANHARLSGTGSTRQKNRPKVNSWKKDWREADPARLRKMQKEGEAGDPDTSWRSGSTTRCLQNSNTDAVRAKMSWNSSLTTIAEPGECGITLSSLQFSSERGDSGLLRSWRPTSKSTMLCVACDPDLHHAGLAIVEASITGDPAEGVVDQSCALLV